MEESKALVHDDESGFLFAKEMLAGDVTAAVNFDRFMKHPEKGFIIMEMIELIETTLNYAKDIVPQNRDDEFVYPEAKECLGKLSKKYKIGMETVWIKQGFGGFATPMTQEEHPNYIVENLSEIIGIFQR